MKRKNTLFPAVSILVLALSILACGTFSAPQATEEPQSAPVTEPPINAPAESSTDPNATVPCAQLIPADELNNLLFNAPATLKENAFPGGTSCEWKYTANGATQESLFYIQVDFSNGAASKWEATRKSELSNEPSDIVANSIDGLGDENYVWSSKVTGQYVVYVRQGERTLIMRYNPQQIIFMGTESGIIDMADRIFNRF
jgi:hypothetical protein